MVEGAIKAETSSTKRVLCDAQGRMLTPRKLLAAKDTNLLRFNSSEKREEFMFMIIRFWNLLHERELSCIDQRPGD